MCESTFFSYTGPERSSEEFLGFSQLCNKKWSPLLLLWSHIKWSESEKRGIYIGFRLSTIEYKVAKYWSDYLLDLFDHFSISQTVIFQSITMSDDNFKTCITFWGGGITLGGKQERRRIYFTVGCNIGVGGSFLFSMSTAAEAGSRFDCKVNFKMWIVLCINISGPWHRFQDFSWVSPPHWS